MAIMTFISGRARKAQSQAKSLTTIAANTYRARGGIALVKLARAIVLAFIRVMISVIEISARGRARRRLMAPEAGFAGLSCQ